MRINQDEGSRNLLIATVISVIIVVMTLVFLMGGCAPVDAGYRAEYQQTQQAGLEIVCQQVQVSGAPGGKEKQTCCYFVGLPDTLNCPAQ